MSEVQTGPGEELGAEAHQGIAPILGAQETESAPWVAERMPEDCEPRAGACDLARGDAAPGPVSRA